MLNMLVFSREDYKNLFYENCEYNVMYTADYHTALKHIRKNTTDIAVLDFDIPGASLLCRYAADSGVTVVSLCPDNSMVIKTAFENSTDEYIVKPFASSQFLHRIKFAGYHKKQLFYTVGDIGVDTSTGAVKKSGETVYLSYMEYRLLLMFLKNKGRVLSHKEIMEKAWGNDSQFLHGNTLTVYIKRLRQKLEDDPNNPKMLKTVRGAGYYMAE